MNPEIRLNRRSFLRRGIAASGALFVSEGLMARALVAASDAASAVVPGYGALRPTAAQNTGETILALPEGFSYNVLGKIGGRMSDGNPTPGAHDGMAAFAGKDGRIRLVRNHELKKAPSAPIGAPAHAYDPTATGGTTTLVIDPTTRTLERDFVSLSGTLVNCAGGATPWGTWISCEETVLGKAMDKDDAGKPIGGYAKEHGYCFEVNALADEPSRAVPLPALGRFVHEAVAVDPSTGIVYLTEDRGTAGFFRLIPEKPGDLRQGGKLQMLRIVGKPDCDTRTGQKPGVSYACDWVPIADPDPSAASTNALAVFEQGKANGAATFARLEGIFYGGGALYLNATSGGDKKIGQVWRYNPKGADGGELTLLFESTDPAILNMPDNLCVSPRGNLVLCEDNYLVGANYLRGLTRDGRIFDFARNLKDANEFAGATFSPDGKTLFFNIQSDWATTFAVWGPWERGPL